MKLLCIGDVNQDIITPRVNYFPLKDEQLIVDQFKWFVGGSVTITACATASLGVDTTLVGCVGKDLIGDMLVNKINNWGVKTIIKRTETPTEVTFAVTFENTSRSFITTIGANKDLLFSDLPSFKGFNHLHLGSYYHMRGLQKSYESIISKARSEGLTISLDPGLIEGANPVLVKKLVPLVDVLFVNELELRSFGGALYCAKKAPIVAVHLGPQGSVVHYKGRKFEAPAVKGKVLNSTGAGDVYNAGFLKEYLRGSNVDDCLISAINTASNYIKQDEQVFIKKK